MACSGGRDSLALLHALWSKVRCHPSFRILVLHVHHGLSPQADAWRDRLQRTCRRWQRGAEAELKFVPLTVKVDRGSASGLEAEARARRYEALTQAAKREGARTIVLAHHRDDQTETVLLQALRGAGPAGLSAMPRQIERDGLLWIRPWLDRRRSEIESYSRRYRLHPVEDESNGDPRFARNRLRHLILPDLRRAFPQVDLALGTVARHAQDAATCLEDLARLDLSHCQGRDPSELSQVALMQLSAARRRNLLRFWLIEIAQSGVTDSLLIRLGHELAAETVRGAGRRRWALGPGRWVELHRQHLTCLAEPEARPQEAVSIRAQRIGPLIEGERHVPGWPVGRLVVSEALPGEPGIRELRLRALGELQVISRQPGMQFQLTARSVPRALVKQFQVRDVHPALRSGPYLLTGSGELLFAPGLGLDGRFLDEGSAQESGRLLTIHWVMQDCVG